MNIPVMKENQFSLLGRHITIGCAVTLAAAALVNVWHGEIRRTVLFVVVLVGFSLFLAAKISLLMQRRWINFGTKFMSPAMANSYRLGYWLMLMGFVATFA